jgi:hypothetical protein
MYHWYPPLLKFLNYRCFPKSRMFQSFRWNHCYQMIH